MRNIHRDLLFFPEQFPDPLHHLPEGTVKPDEILRGSCDWFGSIEGGGVGRGPAKPAGYYPEGSEYPGGVAEIRNQSYCNEDCKEDQDHSADIPC